MKYVPLVLAGLVIGAVSLWTWDLSRGPGPLPIEPLPKWPDALPAWTPRASGPTLSGTLLLASGEPAVGALVQVDLPDGLSWARTNSLGRFALQDMPAGAAVLLIEAHTAELAGQWDATLVPESLARPGSAMARSVWESPAEIQTFFLADHVFPEAEGFWVRGSRTAEVVLSGGAAFAGRTRVMQVRNGGVDNVVTITSGQWREVVTLEAWQEHVVTLPPADVMGSWSLAVTSASGFQPAVLSGGDDTRFLGVWIQ